MEYPGVAQQGSDPSMAATAVAAGQLDHIRNRAVIVVEAARDLALGRAVLPPAPGRSAAPRSRAGRGRVDACGLSWPERVSGHA